MGGDLADLRLHVGPIQTADLERIADVLRLAPFAVRAKGAVEDVEAAHAGVTGRSEVHGLTVRGQEYCVLFVLGVDGGTYVEGLAPLVVGQLDAAVDVAAAVTAFTPWIYDEIREKLEIESDATY